MKLFLTPRESAPTKLPWGAFLEILNADECGVDGIEIYFGKLYYVNRCSLRRRSDIEKGECIDSYVDKSYAPGFQVHADFDVYLKDGRVVEVSTWMEKIIEVALKYAPAADPRAAVREARRARK